MLAPHYRDLQGPISSLVPGFENDLHLCFAKQIMPPDGNWSMPFNQGHCESDCGRVNDLTLSMRVTVYLYSFFLTTFKSRNL